MNAPSRARNWSQHALAACLGSVVPMLFATAQDAVPAHTARDADVLYQEFVRPPASARPRVWWHWIDGNITKEGIKLDLEWMQRIGLGGFQNFNVSMRTPKVVNERLAYMTPAWTDALRYATDLAEAHGLEMAIAASPGWSETGGPWVEPKQAMKKVVWSELEIEGGKPFTGKLSQPPNVSGPFQDTPREAGPLGPPKNTPFYSDAAVVAYPVLDDGRAPKPVVRVTTGDAIDEKMLSDGLLGSAIKLKFGTEAAPTCIGFDYGRASSIASVLLAAPIGSDFFHSPTSRPRLEASDDGTTFRKVTDLPAGGIIQHTTTFPAISARHFRVCFAPPPPPYTDLLDAAAPGAARFSMGPQKSADEFEVSELRLFSVARVHRVEEKAGFAHADDYYAIATPSAATNDAVPVEKVVDLTNRLKSDGTLDWRPPPGRWKILRFGYSLTGKENAPATPEATGLEVDKLDREHVRAYLDTYLSKYESAVGKERIGKSGIRALLVDSFEAGAQNWTTSFPAEFRRRRGYDLTPWMPALAGTVVGSAESTDRFLYDFRRTLGDLLAENHYGQIAEAARGRGLIQYGEAFEQGRPALGDDMDMRRYASVPMSAMWTYAPSIGARPGHYADMRGAASIAHIYGQNLVAAESLTSAFAPWAHAPRDLKPMIDYEFVQGVNRPIIHTSVHQPLLDKVPGLTLLIFGQYFNRNETWAEQAGAWVSYLARTSQLLQQGKFAADVAYFYGEEAPLTTLYREQIPPDVPSGVGFDFANADVVLNRLKVDRGDLVTASGMRYRILYLGGTSERMTLPVLRRIAELVRDGATVVGNKPIATPSLANDPKEFAELSQSLWSGAGAGKGRVIPGRDVDSALTSLGVLRDFEYRKPQPDSEIMFLHRRVDDGDVYFLTNRKAREENLQATFRVSGKRPEIWRAETGTAEPVSFRTENGRTTIPLKLAPHDSFFVVFREPVSNDATTAVPEPRQLATLDEEWEVSFQAGRGGPDSAKKLAAGSWSDSSDPTIRYFSGTATYSRELTVPQAWLDKASRVVLDLGEVRELADVSVNGQSLRVLWHPPYRVDVTDSLKRGRNRIELRVTNLWVNRLIGDAQPGARKITFTVLPPYQPDAPLRPSGLLGPVRVEQVSKHRVSR